MTIPKRTPIFPSQLQYAKLVHGDAEMSVHATSRRGIDGSGVGVDFRSEGANGTGCRHAHNGCERFVGESDGRRGCRHGDTCRGLALWAAMVTRGRSLTAVF